MGDVKVNGRAPVTKASKHRAIAPLDFCYTPSPVGMVPIPYVNMVSSSHLHGGSSHVRIKGAHVMLAGSQLKPSTGNEPGTGGGVISHCTRGPARALVFSLTVRIEGKGVVRGHDITLQNKCNCIGKIC